MQAKKTPKMTIAVDVSPNLRPMLVFARLGLFLVLRRHTIRYNVSIKVNHLIHTYHVCLSKTGSFSLALTSCEILICLKLRVMHFISGCRALYLHECISSLSFDVVRRSVLCVIHKNIRSCRAHLRIVRDMLDSGSHCNKCQTDGSMFLSCLHWPLPQEWVSSLSYGIIQTNTPSKSLHHDAAL